MKEFYAVKPAEIEVHTYGGGSDIILRKNITQEAEPGNGMEQSEGGVRWSCDERQMRVDGTVEVDDISLNFESWWRLADSSEKSLGYRVGTLETRTDDTEEALKMILERTVV